MRIHELKAPRGSRKKTKRVGRGSGSGRGKTSGRGQKGQKAHSGKGGPYLGFEGGQMPLIRRIPKRGFTGRKGQDFQIVNIEKLNVFRKDTVVSLEELKRLNLIKKETRPVKILGAGSLRKPLTIRAHRFTKTALEKIKEVKGKAELIGEVKDA